jgi:hypothetical protein
METLGEPWWMSDNPRIVIFIAWFGRWPAWFRFFVESCRWNPTVDWVLIGDGGAIADAPPNIRLIDTGLADYRAFVGERLGVVCRWDSAYKLCDLKPLFADLHPDLVAGYAYWGFGDLDVIYGDIRSIYTPDVLRHDIVSTHDDITAGHLTLVRNHPKLNRAYRRVRGWKGIVSDAAHRGFDERHWSHLFTPVAGTLLERVKLRLRSPRVSRDVLLVERFSTDLPPRPWIDGTRDYPEVWTWREGHLTADKAGDRAFLYLHFSCWQSNRWSRRNVAPWKSLDRLDQLPPGRPTAFSISARGFTPVEAPPRAAPGPSAP